MCWVFYHMHFFSQAILTIVILIATYHKCLITVIAANAI